MTQSLSDKIADIEAFEATPAGAALKRYRDCVTVLALVDEAARPADWDHFRNLVRRADLALIAEIETLNHDIERHVSIANELADKNEAMILALGMIAGKNDLSGVHDADIESAARGVLHECELIAREALGEYEAVRRPEEVSQREALR